MKDEVDFLPADKRQRFFQIDIIFLSVRPGMSKLPKMTSLLFLSDILRKKWVIKMIYRTQINMKACYKLMQWFWCCWSNVPKVTGIASLLCLYNVWRKKLEMKLIFCVQINIKVSCYLISAPWASRFSRRWCYHYCWSRILKVRKIISFQYSYNILKKCLGTEFIFCM